MRTWIGIGLWLLPAMSAALAGEPAEKSPAAQTATATAKDVAIELKIAGQEFFAGEDVPATLTIRSLGKAVHLMK